MYNGALQTGWGIGIIGIMYAGSALVPAVAPAPPLTKPSPSTPLYLTARPSGTISLTTRTPALKLTTAPPTNQI